MEKIKVKGKKILIIILCLFMTLIIFACKYNNYDDIIKSEEIAILAERLHVTVVMIKDHQYIIAHSSAIDGGISIIHSKSCPNENCKTNNKTDEK